MKRQLIALVGAIAVLLAIGSGVAQAQSVQGVEQISGTGQSADSSATSTQRNPSNSNISVRIFSEGDNGSVSQSNNSVAGSAAVNKAATTQTVEQAGGGAGEQAVGQIGGTIQDAKSAATSTQTKPTNSNISVRIHSKGSDGAVEQSNNSLAGSVAANKAETTQNAGQGQGGGMGSGSDCCSGGAGVQAVGQKAFTGQKAESHAESQQDHASNENVPVRIGSEGGGGSVSQQNNSAALSFAGNAAKTTQGVEQSQGGGCGCGGDAVQAVGQKALTGQIASSDATSTQRGAKNSTTPVRLYSEGDDGDVEQSNTSLALSAAINAAKTEQSVGQSQSGAGGCGCGYGGARVQAVGQWGETWQKGNSDAVSEQLYPSNSNAPVREKSNGGGGSVSQSNDSLAASLALNLAHTLQAVRQVQ